MRCVHQKIKKYEGTHIWPDHVGVKKLIEVQFKVSECEAEVV